MFDECNTCKHRQGYQTGADEYPPYVIIEYCAKGRWEDTEQPEPAAPLISGGCPDFEIKNQTDEPTD